MPLPVKRSYFHSETLKRISRLDLRARHIVEGFLSGMHKSRHFGSSVEFRQHRQYVPGDDPRNVDWKVWAKQDKYYVKQYDVDTNLRCTILMDVSQSMRYGYGAFTKYDYGCTIAASLAYLAMRQQDAVGCITFEKDTDAILPARMKQTHLGAIVEILEQSDPGRLVPDPKKRNVPASHSGTSDDGDTDDATALSTSEAIVRLKDIQPNLRDSLLEAAETIPRHGLVVLISDLLVRREGLFQGLNYLRSRNHDVLVMHVMDDDELDFTQGGPTRFEGLEVPAYVRCDPRMLRQGYLAALQDYLEEIRRGCSLNQSDYALFRTSTPLDAALSAYLTHRSALVRSRSGRRR